MPSKTVLPMSIDFIAQPSSSVSYSEAIMLSIGKQMMEDKSVLVYGLGVDDPKRIFGTTTNLLEKFGSKRVFDMPTSENAMTGVAIGATFAGYKTIMIHQRLDFFLLIIIK